ncbi:hypothetical protein [Pseudomonas sp. ANT_J28]|uniref:hypothetical protein n=1 Tax=Pseudomonas sp. ANT_J28 TaxID=2597352 RepID=UPI0011F24D2B|nr:hypothetical protein [Pseudomonas sp. ANT_J28]KAA0984921.1 hypothetical protein FQ187_07925 [Pseudomonas sp. ANT_J28]
MQFSGVRFLIADSATGSAMFHRRYPQQAPDIISYAWPRRSLEQELMLRQLFISGAVAACNMEVIDRNAVKNDPFAGLVLSASVVKYI